MLLRKRIPSPYWNHPGAAPAVFCAIVVALWAVDNLVNDMFNPVFMLMVGGLSAFPKQVPPQEGVRPDRGQADPEAVTGRGASSTES